MDVKSLKKLKVLKNLLLGDRSKSVLLLEGPGCLVVAKKYDRHSKQQVGRFNKEVLILKTLQGCRYVPKLYNVDDRKKTIYMEYVGKNPKIMTAEQKTAVNQILRHMAEKYHVFRVKGGIARYTYKDLFHANICVDEKSNVRLIDFGSSLWEIHNHSYKTYLSHANSTQSSSNPNQHLPPSNQSTQPAKA